MRLADFLIKYETRNGTLDYDTDTSYMEQLTSLDEVVDYYWNDRGWKMSPKMHKPLIDMLVEIGNAINRGDLKF